MLPFTLSPSVYRAILPRPKVRTVDWAEGRIPAPPPVKGRIRFDLVPYAREVCDVLDSPEYDEVTLQWGSRLGKTTTVQCWMFNVAANNCRPGLWAEPDKPSLARVFKRAWDMIDGTAGLAEKALPRHQRSNDELRFEDSILRGAYSGSPSTAADFAAFYAVLNELDKFTHRRRLDPDGEESGEADFAELCAERCKGAAGAKIVNLSTPTVKGRSAIEGRRLEGDRRRFYVPCPHCNHRQTLRTGRSKDEPGGLKWPAKAKDAAAIAETAWYECERCRKKILDEHRYAMINAGVWIKEGQSIDRKGKVRGKPFREGRHASFGPLGTLYSLLPTITWGAIAAKFHRAIKEPTRKKLRNFINGWEGDTWDPAPPQTTVHELAARLKSDVPRGTVPSGSFTTLAADTGVAGEALHFWWMVCAWNPLLKRGHVVDWGKAETVAELDAVAAQYSPLRVGIDAGGGKLDAETSVADRVYEITAARGRHWWPLRGSSGDLGPDWYVEGFQRAGLTPHQVRKKKRHGLGDLLYVNSQLTQASRESIVYGRIKPDDPGFVTLPAEVAALPERFTGFLKELTSDYRDGRKWSKRGDNEFGDTLRYNRALAEHALLGGTLWGTAVDLQTAGRPAARPEGWFSQQKRRR